MNRVFHIFKGLAAMAVVFPLLFAQEAEGAVILDWTDWAPTFDDGDDGKQRFTNADGVEIEFDPKAVNANGNPRPEFILGTPAIQSVNGVGDALVIEQSAEPGDGSRHRLRLRGGETMQGASFVIGGIDGSTTGGDNYIDELVFSAELEDGTVVTPTRIYVSNSLDVSQIGADTVSAVANSGSVGSVEVFFDYADIERFEIQFFNSTTGTVADTADDQGFWMGDLFETGITTVPVPEPSALALGLVGMALLLRRRR